MKSHSSRKCVHSQLQSRPSVGATPAHHEGLLLWVCCRGRWSDVLGCDEEVDGRRSNVTTSAELTSAEPEVFGRGKRDCINEGESAVEAEDRDGSGMLVGK